MVGRYYHDVEKEAMRRMILDEGVRLDGRNTEQIRPIWCEVGYLPGPHGSSVFTRGETQSLSTVTLGTKLDEKIVDEATEQGRERFFYCIIIFRRSLPVKRKLPEGWDVVKSVMEIWHTVH